MISIIYFFVSSCIFCINLSKCVWLCRANSVNSSNVGGANGAAGNDRAATQPTTVPTTNFNIFMEITTGK